MLILLLTRASNKPNFESRRKNEKQTTFVCLPSCASRQHHTTTSNIKWLRKVGSTDSTDLNVKRKHDQQTKTVNDQLKEKTISTIVEAKFENLGNGRGSERRFVYYNSCAVASIAQG